MSPHLPSPRLSTIPLGYEPSGMTASASLRPGAHETGLTSRYAAPSPACLFPLAAIVRRPGSRAAEIGDAYSVGQRLRRLREAGLVESNGSAPARWYPTAAGEREVNRLLLAMLRERARNARKQALAMLARAEALYAFAEALTKPAPPLLSAPPRHRTLSFRELASTLRQSVRRDVLISTNAGRIWPQVTPITAVGTIDRVEEERGFAVEDWLITLTVGETAFVEFSRRHFQSAEEDLAMGELRVQQGAETVIWFEPAVL